MPVLQKQQKLGDYTVVRRLGEGQFAEVWEVKDASGARVSLWLRAWVCMRSRSRRSLPVAWGWWQSVAAAAKVVAVFAALTEKQR